MNPAFTEVLSKFSLREQANNITGVRALARAELISALMKNGNTYTRILLNESGKHIHIPSLKTGQEKKIFADFEVNYNKNLNETALNYLAGKIFLTSSQLAGVLQTIGLNVIGSEPKSDYKFRKEGQALLRLINEGKNPFDIESVHILRNLIKYARFEGLNPYQEKTFGLNGKSQYAIGEYNHLDHMVNKLTQVRDEINSRELNPEDARILLYQ